MTETTRACKRGCSMYRNHLTDCEDPDACRGCLPRRATNGNFCQSCHRRFELMLTDAPIVDRWLTGNLTGSKGGYDQDIITGTKGDGPPLPIKAAIYDIRQLLADRLSAWVDDFAEDVKVSKPQRSTVEADSAFLLRWIKSIELCDWVGDWWQELAETMSEAHALAPWRPAMRRLPKVPCPGCEEINLAIFGGESDITCLSCGILMTEDRYMVWERILKDEREVAS